MTNASKYPSREEYNRWAEHTTQKVIARLEQRFLVFQQDPKAGISTQTVEKAQEKYAFMRYLLEKHEEEKSAFENLKHKKDNSRSEAPADKKEKEYWKKTTLEKIINGLLGEFVRQSHHEIVECNIENGRNPEAKAYWDQQSEEAFEGAIHRGMSHLATSYANLEAKHLTATSKLLNKKRETGGRSSIFHGTGEIVRASIDVFKEEYPQLEPDKTPKPSLYNDYHHLLNRSFKLSQLYKGQSASNGR